MKKLLSTFYFLLSTFYFTSPVQAVVCNPILSNCNSSTAPKTYFNNVLSVVISIFFYSCHNLLHLAHSLCCYHLISSEGDPKRWETGKMKLPMPPLAYLSFFLFCHSQICWHCPWYSWTQHSYHHLANSLKYDYKFIRIK
jgi:hypothetical protein